MTYTLFVDESGKFDKPEKWVVAGILLPRSKDESERRLSEVLAPYAMREGLRSPGASHLTVLRKKWSGDHARVGAYGEGLLQIAVSRGGLCFAVVNEAGGRMRDPERTYRLMVLDLLALVDAAAPVDLDRLDLVVARRSRKNKLMTTEGEMLADVIDRIDESVEADLAARGLRDRLKNDPFEIRPADESWGLAAADAVANLTFQSHHTESGDVVERLREKGMYRSFESFGGFEERRALVAERDGHLSVAVARWARLESDARVAALDRIWARARGQGTTGLTATLDATIEQLWRGEPDPARLAVLLGRLGNSLGRVAAPEADVYRVRDMLHLLANGRGDVAEALRLIGLQRASDPVVSGDPSTLPLVLKSLFHRLVTFELERDSERGLEAARTQAGVVEQYGLLADMLRESLGVAGGPATSAPVRIDVKARTSLARALLVRGGAECVAEAVGLLDVLLTQDLGAKDELRARCYRVWADVRSGEVGAAVARAEALLSDGEDDEFALLFAARAASDGVLLGEVSDERAGAVLETVRGRMAERVRYPYDLMWRDIGVLQALVGRGSKASRSAFRMAREALDAQPPSPLSDWKRYGILLSEAAVRSPGEAPLAGPERMVVSGATARDAAVEYRRVSPY